MIARLSADGKTVVLSGGGWSDTFEISNLTSQLAFYRGLRDRGGKAGYPGPYAAHYEPTIKALERVEKIARAMGSL